ARAIRANFHQRIALAYVEWASANYQRLLIDWTVIEDAASADEFAAALAAAPVFGRCQRQSASAVSPSD
ncbi:DUF1194 domain-containing protein, partial [Acetobacter lovaniensis]|uniref:DUF1194 domain-containing protein n=1 Tax=Acetobacter lovaniensis TaxID=104100 RepID=UPI00376F52DB